MLRRSPTLLVALAAACSPTPDDRPRVTRVDSAGVEIVSSERAGWTEGERWRVDSLPMLSIGAAEGEEPYLFGQARGAVRVGGRIAVADAQTGEIRFFDLGGTHLETVGGLGEGPGEFRALVELWRCGRDRIHAYDFLTRTVQVRSPDGELVRTVAVELPGGRSPLLIECSAGGTGFLAVARPEIGRGDIDGREGTVIGQRAPVFLLDPTGAVAEELSERLVSEQFYARLPDGARVSSPHPFGRALSVELGPDHIYLGTGRSFEIEVRTRGGRLVRKLRGPADDPAAALADLLEQYREAELPTDAERRRSWLAEADWPMPEGSPAYTGLRLDGSGNLWVERFSPPWSEESRWAIFGPDGAFLGHVDLPEGLSLTDLGDDWLLGLREDDLGVQRVQLFGLRKGSAG